jgi:hypothetical protein
MVHHRWRHYASCAPALTRVVITCVPAVVPRLRRCRWQARQQAQQADFQAQSQEEGRGAAWGTGLGREEVPGRAARSSWHLQQNFEGQSSSCLQAEVVVDSLGLPRPRNALPVITAFYESIAAAAAHVPSIHVSTLSLKAFQGLGLARGDAHFADWTLIYGWWSWLR